MSKQPTNQDILNALHAYHLSTEKRFTGIDKRFESMDKRFESMDKRFDKVELKLNNVLYLAVQNQQVLKGLVTREEFDVFRDNTASRLDMMIGNTITVEHELVFVGEQQDRNTSAIKRIEEQLQGA